jgi:hypothetical protein
MTIDLVLASEELVDVNIRYVIYGMKYGLDYCMIEMVFNISVLALK